jgi:hypothetical protein
MKLLMFFNKSNYFKIILYKKCNFYRNYKYSLKKYKYFKLFATKISLILTS